MKIRSLFVFLFVILGGLAPRVLADQAGATPSPLYVVISTTEPIEFKQYRHARADGRELILSTLKMRADQQARFAGYPGDVTVLDEKDAPPADAAVLRLTWTADVVAAELIAHAGAKPQYLGVVSRSPLSEHPDFKAMQHEIDQSGASDKKRDATLRAKTEMNLYLALLRAKRELKP